LHIQSVVMATQKLLDTWTLNWFIQTEVLT